MTIDRNLNFAEHIHDVAQRVRKLTFIFKQLRHVADSKTIKNVYLALAQSTLSYCLSSWGGAAKSKLIELERAQRLILKVSLFKPRLYPTTALYQLAEVLTVRQLFVLLIILRQHSSMHYSPNAVTVRRQYNVCDTEYFRTAFMKRFFSYLGSRLYNHANKIINIYHNNKTECKKKLTQWLLQQTYEDTEKIIK